MLKILAGWYSGKNIAIGVVGLGFNFWAGKIAQCRQRLATAAMFLCCPSAKLHAWALLFITCFEYNEDLI